MKLKLPRGILNQRYLSIAIRRIEDWAAQISVPPEVVATFTQQDLAANLTASKLWNGNAFVNTGASGDLQGRQVGITMPWAGAIVAASLVASVAKTAGGASFETYVSGVASGAVLHWNNNDHDYDTWGREDFTFSAGDVLDVRATTTAGFLPVTSEVAVTLFLLRAP